MADERVRREYGDDDALDGLVPPSDGGAGKDAGGVSVVGGRPPAASPRSLLWYLATLQAFAIVYRTEVALGAVLAASVGFAVGEIWRHRHPRARDPFAAAAIGRAYSSYEHSLGGIDHWCLRGDDNSCRCEDPLEPMGKHEGELWEIYARRCMTLEMWM